MPEINDSLPENLPAEWLNQISDLLNRQKPRVWIAIVGSSLFATVIGGVIAYFDHKDVAKRTTQLEVQVDRVRARTSAYSQLSKALYVFASRLDGYANLVEIADRYPADRKTRANIRSARKDVGQAEQAVMTAKSENDRRLLDTAKSISCGGVGTQPYSIYAWDSTCCETNSGHDRDHKWQ